MNGRNLAKQNHWDAAYENLVFFRPNRFDPIRKIVGTYVGKAAGDQNAFEVGCFPGRYLTVLGDLGYRLNGIDLTPRVEKELPQWLSQNGYVVGDFYHADFLQFSGDHRYDVLCSFGFIEHFTNFREIIKKHATHVASQGLIVVTTPNFRGSIQKALHQAFDKENLERHHLPAMDPFVWKSVLEIEGFDILFCGWKGGFDFWAEDKRNNLLGKVVIKMLNLLGKLSRSLPFNHRSFSPYSVIVARRKDINI